MSLCNELMHRETQGCGFRETTVNLMLQAPAAACPEATRREACLAAACPAASREVAACPAVAVRGAAPAEEAPQSRRSTDRARERQGHQGGRWQRPRFLAASKQFCIRGPPPGCGAISMAASVKCQRVVCWSGQGVQGVDRICTVGVARLVPAVGFGADCSCGGARQKASRSLISNFQGDFTAAIIHKKLMTCSTLVLFPFDIIPLPTRAVPTPTPSSAPSRNPPVS